jgi:hypothetical protein
MPPKGRATRSAAKGNSDTDEGASSGREEEPSSTLLSRTDPIGPAHALTSGNVPLQHSVAQEAGQPVIPHNSQYLTEPPRNNAPLPSDSLPNGQTGKSRDLVSIAHGGSAGGSAVQTLIYTPVPSRHRSPFNDATGWTHQVSQMRGDDAPALDGAALAAMLRATYSPEMLQAALHSLGNPSALTSTPETPAINPGSIVLAPFTVVRHGSNEVIVIDSPPPPSRGVTVAPPLCTPSSPARKRDVPGNPSSSSNSADSTGQAPALAVGVAHTPHISSHVASRVVSPRGTRRSATLEYPQKCPVCLIPVHDLPADHNPYHCVKSNAPRSVLEEQQCNAIAASRRVLQDMGLGASLQPRYALADSEERGHEDVPSLQRQFDSRVQAVREDERRNYNAGVDVLASESRSRDPSATPSHASSSSSYVPSSSTSTASSAPPPWASALATRIEQMSQTLTEVVRTQQRHNSFIDRFYSGQSPGWQQPQFFPPGFLPMGQYMPMPMVPPPASMQEPFIGGPSQQFPSDSDSAIPMRQSHTYQPQGGVYFHDQLGTVSPSMMHTARPRGGMRGAPELAPEDIGNVGKFNEFLQRHATYAAAAREQNQSWATVAGLLARYSDDLAVAFNACAIKRGEPPNFDAHMVLHLSDDHFERLYLEACAPSVEYPSQVLQLLEAVPFVRQQPPETNPMPALLRAAEAFRVQLRLLPTRAVSECKDDALAMAFMTLLFRDSAKHRSNDFQRCTTWTQLKDALIRCAASNPSWFGNSLHPIILPSAPSPDKAAAPHSAPSTSVESSVPSSKESPTDLKRMADRVAKMKADGELKGLDIAGLSDKQILKLANKARWRAKIGAEAVAEAKLDVNSTQSKIHLQLEEQGKLIALLAAQMRNRHEPRDRTPERTRDGDRTHSADRRVQDPAATTSQERSTTPRDVTQSTQRAPSPFRK